MADFTKLNGYTVKDPNALHTYDTVADLKADTKLKVGNHAQTKGYTTAGDGGHGTYIIVDDNTLVDDGGSIHELTNGLFAVLLNNGYVTPEMFGAYGDGVHDDTSAIQKCLNYNAKHAILSRVYLTNQYLSVPSNKIIDGGGEIHSSSIGFKLDGVRYITIKDLRIYAPTNAIYIVSDSSYCSYIKIENIYANGYISEQEPAGDKAIYIEATNEYINECYYDKCVMYNYEYGIYAISDEYNSPQMQRHIFNECSPEGSTVAGVYVKNGERFTFENCRCLEGNSSKWVTEGTCSAFNIISGEAWFAPYTNAQFSTGTNGVIIGALRNANVGLSSPGRNGFIVNGKVIASIENINPYFKNITSAGLTIAYGDELATQFRMITGSDTTLSLTSDCYGGICKINEFYIRTNAGVGNLTVQVGDYFTKVITGQTDPGYKYYRFTYNTLEDDKSWFVEELNLV